MAKTTISPAGFLAVWMDGRAGKAMTRFLGRAITNEITSQLENGAVRHELCLSNSALYCIFTVVKFNFQRKIPANVHEFSVVRPEYQ
jgi:hypothetical protein